MKGILRSILGINSHVFVFIYFLFVFISFVFILFSLISFSGYVTLLIYLKEYLIS